MMGTRYGNDRRATQIFQQFIKTDISTAPNLSQLSIWGLKITSFSSLLIGEPSSFVRQLQK